MLSTVPVDFSNSRLAHSVQALFGSRPVPSGRGYGAASDPKTEIHKWQGSTCLQELGVLEKVAKQFSRPIYPEMTPAAFCEDEE